MKRAFVFTPKPSVNSIGDKLIQTTTITPHVTPNTASTLRAFLVTYPNRNKPNIPPLNMEDKAHQASKALSTFKS